MILSSKDALEIINGAKKSDGKTGWVDHSICVGNTAAKIAKALNDRGFDLDLDKVKSLGYIHDIGKMVGDFNNHVTNGYKYLKAQGYDDEYADICLVHSYLNNDIFCVAGGIKEEEPWLSEFVKNHEYTMYEKIINLCDLMCTKKILTVDKRLIDIMIRRGAHANTQYHIVQTYKLKEYFDNLLGYDLYNLFPEIKDNL